MLICHLCLRTDRKLQDIDKKLANMLDTLCYFTRSASALYCAECKQMLKKFYAFWEKCLLAVKILKGWKIEKNNVPIEQLYKQMPPSRLSICKRENCKVFICQESELSLGKAPLKKIGTTNKTNTIIEPKNNLGIDCKPQTYNKKRTQIDLTKKTCKDDVDGLFNYDIEQGIDRIPLVTYSKKNTAIDLKNNKSVHADSQHKKEGVNNKCFDNDPFNNSKVQNDLKVTNIEIDGVYELDNIVNECDTVNGCIVLDPIKIKPHRIEYDYNNDDSNSEMDPNMDTQFVQENEENDVENNEINSSQDCRSDGENTEDDYDVACGETEYDIKYLLNSGKYIDTVFDPTKLNKDIIPQTPKLNVIPQTTKLNVIHQTTKLKFELQTTKINKDIPQTTKLNEDIHQKNAKRVLDDVDKGEVDATVSKKFKMNNSFIEHDHDYMKLTKKTKMLADLANQLSRYGIRDMPSDAIELLRNMLKIKFESSGELFDGKGNAIDTEHILNSLDKMPGNTLIRIKKHCANYKSLKPEAISLLARLQKMYNSEYDSVFSTEHLSGQERVMEEFLKRQHLEKYINTEHKCTLCYRGFRHKKLLEYHVNTYHDESAEHTCTVCQMRFRNKSRLAGHERCHLTVYKCKLCPYVTNYKEQMINHYYFHKEEVYTCQICEKTFKSPSCLEVHMNSHEAQYYCGVCARAFATEAGVVTHRAKKHKNDSMFDMADSRSCDLCNVLFVSEEVYLKHLKITHAPRKVTRIQRTCSAKKKEIMCRVCNITQRNIIHLKIHFKQEHPNESFEIMYLDRYQYLCHICGKGFSNITKLEEHKNLHTGAKPYACEQCPKTFHKKENMKNHMKRHLPPANECPYCGKVLYNLNKHMKAHIGDRKFKCHICSKAFLHRTDMKQHIRGVHQKIRPLKKCVRTEGQVEVTML